MNKRQRKKANKKMLALIKRSIKEAMKDNVYIIKGDKLELVGDKSARIPCVQFLNYDCVGWSRVMNNPKREE